METFSIDPHVEGAKTVAISGHIRPDGDCIGSCLGMAQYLQKAHKDLRVDVFLEEVPAIFSFIKGAENVNTSYVTDVDSYDCFLVLDAAAERTGKAKTLFDRAKKTVNIDHHISNKEGCADINFVVPEASSTCELVYESIAKDLIDVDLAVALYSGMVTDTGVFKYSCTSPRTMQIAGELISYGFDFGRIVDAIFYGRTFVQQRLTGMALTKAKLYFDGACIVSSIDKQTLSEEGALSSDLEGIASQMKLTEGVHCALFAYGLSDDEYKVSMRSDEVVDVAKIATTVEGGGGHARAAGCNIKGTFEEVEQRLLPLIEAALQESRA